MSIRVALNHKTVYRYRHPVVLSPQLVRLRPAPHTRTQILSYSLTITPPGHFINWQQDPESNYLARLVFPEKVTEFAVEVDLIAEMAIFNPFDFFLDPAAENFPFKYDPALAVDLAPYLVTEPQGPLLAKFMREIPKGPAQTTNFLVDLNRNLEKKIGYVIRMEPGIQPTEETLARCTGSCRDSAWLLVQILRHLGLAARFVSGYLIQLVPDAKPLEGPAGASHDFTDLHAWAEVYLPGAGWIGLDPTSGLLAGEGHIPLACTPEPVSAAPITGASDEVAEHFDFSMSVARIAETPRVTKPYTDEQWQSIDALGRQVDKMLEAGDVRLTMGGEPTFIAVDDMDGPEWNIAALGPEKRRRGFELLCKLRDHFAPDGLLTFGQGKWYPGESLPRWAFSLFWRGDGRPLWQSPDLIAEEGKDQTPDEETARMFAERLAEHLGLDSSFVVAAYEDPLHYIAREQHLPVNVDPFESRLDDPEERARLARVFDYGLDRPVGFVLPLQWWNAIDQRIHWVSGHWRFRRERLYVAPGDAPLGFRLPLDQLPWIAPVDYPWYVPLDPFAPRSRLSEPPRRMQNSLPRTPVEPLPGKQREQKLTASSPAHQTANGMTSDSVRTALCVQPRDGKLCVFLPPVEAADGYVDLITAIETVAGELSVPLHIEGYPPPPDARLNLIKVTPDPGVIEVNIHPAASWRSLAETTTTLYDCAREAGLGAEKFMIDGRHVGTGGGNHVVVGGQTAADSPFLRRPDLLGSLIRYWHNHPALSYLFSGLFIGPTSQAPRTDEARDDTLYELEIALRQLPSPGVPVPPWLVDRVLRNVLVDVTGNTHRAEICIDKLYSPDSPTGRLGLVEFRAFEMPPHARMSLAQQLLLRALIARFWVTPYTAPLARWGGALRDRFMLPHFVWQDFADVIDEMRQNGLPFDVDWFAPHFEFRFPRYGAVRHAEIEIELRHALEPWHVMGEEPAAGGAVRYVDSSLERLQIKVDGVVGERHVVSCNGMKVPLVATGKPGEFVAGVRFRAWQPASALHPTIGVHTPLTFDVYDSWSGRSVGGCIYHVAHPGGRNYSTLPVNANEAESRRLARFQSLGHTPGPMAPPVSLDNPDFPLTLDLRFSVS